jgi:magnesium chelatase family protein
VFPSDFLLVAAMNPCPCGYLGDPRRPCTCDAHERRRYGHKLSGPLLDRIDLHVAMAAVPWRDLAAQPRAQDSEAIRERVRRARDIAGSRAPGVAGFRNADLPAQDLVQLAALDRAGRAILETAVTRLRLSVRALHRALRVARTIADLDASARVAAEHLSEALAFRMERAMDPALRDAGPAG